jgi:hypothetical protein
MTDTMERRALTREQLLAAYRQMRTIREFEERVHARPRCSPRSRRPWPARNSRKTRHQNGFLHP